MLHLNGILKAAPAGFAWTAWTWSRRTWASSGQGRLVFQNPDDQLFSTTVYEDVAFGPSTWALPRTRCGAGWSRPEYGGIPDFAPRMPHHLSVGERKRVHGHRAVDGAQLLVLDEPRRASIPRAAASSPAADLDATMLVSTHDMAMVAELFDRTSSRRARWWPMAD